MKNVSGALFPFSRDMVSWSKRSHNPTARTNEPINYRKKEKKKEKLKCTLCDIFQMLKVDSASTATGLSYLIPIGLRLYYR